MDLYEGATSLSELQELNNSLRALAAVFPNVRPEVFREMLTTLSRESRTQVVAEHLLRSGDKWIKGRWRVDESRSSTINTLSEARHDTGQTADRSGGGDNDRLSQSEATVATHNRRYSGGPAGEKGAREEPELVPLPETFRSPSYKAAVFVALRHEFTGLSKSTISGVLAEQNHCYTLSRPILTDLASKTLRSSITNFVMRAFGFGSGAHGGSRGKNAPLPNESHFMLQWSSSGSSSSSHIGSSSYGGHASLSSSSYTISSSSSGDKTFRTPSLKSTGNEELDLELELAVLQPLLDRRRRREDQISLELAILLNEHEAEQAGAMYECQVCFGEAAWEQMAACTGSDDGHIICFECLQRSVSEAVYGQSWDLTIDHARGQLACLAPTSSPCDGCIPQALSERAVLSAKGGAKMWQQLQSRLVDESLHQSGAALIRCPFCPYAELDSLYLPTTPTWHLNLRSPPPTLLLHLLLAFDLTVLTALITLLFSLTVYLPFSTLLPSHFHPLAIRTHLANLWRSALATDTRRRHLPQRFTCRSPHCGRASCLDCRRAWRDPHHCYEADAVSLRTMIEAARTAALKRTCPRCAVSFVKASGCNKMVCVCGYAMCYVCRQGLKGKKGRGIGAGGGGAAAGGAGEVNADGVVVEAAAPVPAENNEEGYRHFCQHFRPTGGACTECDRCDLYRAEDEDEAVRAAGEAAEAEWRARNGIKPDVVLPGEGEQAGKRRGWRAGGGGTGAGTGAGDGDGDGDGGPGVMDRNTDGTQGSVRGKGQQRSRAWWAKFSLSSRDVDAAIQRLFEWWIARVLVSRLPVVTSPSALLNMKTEDKMTPG